MAQEDTIVESWSDVCAADAVQGPPWPVVEVGERVVRLVRDGDGSIHAVAPVCPHLGSPLSRAVVTGTTLECPHHWYAFDLATGQNTNPGYDDCRLTRYDVRIVDDRVHVAVEAVT